MRPTRPALAALLRQLAAATRQQQRQHQHQRPRPLLLLASPPFSPAVARPLASAFSAARSVLALAGPRSSPPSNGWAAFSSTRPKRRQEGGARGGGGGGGGNRGDSRGGGGNRGGGGGGWSESRVTAAARAALADSSPRSPAAAAAAAPDQQDEDPAAAAGLSDPKRLLRRLQSAPSAAEAERTLLLALPHLNHIHLSAASVRASRLARRPSAAARAEQHQDQQEQQEQQDQQDQPQEQQGQEEDSAEADDLARLMATLERLHERALPLLPARALAHFAAAEAAAGRPLPPRLARGVAEQLLRSGGRKLRAASAFDLAMLAWGLAAHERRALHRQLRQQQQQQQQQQQAQAAAAAIATVHGEDWMWPEELWDALSERIAAQGRRGGSSGGGEGDDGGGGGGGGAAPPSTAARAKKQGGLRALDLRQLSRMARAYACAGRTMSDAALEALSDAALTRLDDHGKEAVGGEDEDEENEASSSLSTATAAAGKQQPTFVPLARNLQAPDPEPLVHLAWALGRMGGCRSGPAADALLLAVRGALEPQLPALVPAALAAAVGGLAAAQHASAPGFVAAAAPFIVEKARLLNQDALVEVSRAYANCPLADADAGRAVRGALAARCEALLLGGGGAGGGAAVTVTSTSARKLLRDLGAALPEEVQARLEAIAGGREREVVAAATNAADDKEAASAL